jgi:membrane protein DedA with SNARE-associated domain/membrane-associated phospholipid phosphatase
MIEDLIEDLGRSLGQWSYLLVAFMAFAETAAFIGFVAPGEVTVIFGGVLAGQGSLSIVLLIGIVWTAAVLGDTVGFMLGRRLGRNFVLKYGHYVRLSEERLVRVEAYFNRHGGKTILAGRWIGFVRPLMPFTAGASGMPYRRFLPFDVVSAGAWSAAFCLLGFIFWRSFHTLTKVVGRGALALSILAAVVVGAVILYRRLRDPTEREKLAEWFRQQGRRPLLRPLAFVLARIWRLVLRPVWRFALAPLWRVLHPPLRFLVNRVTPGELGIQFTSLLAIGAVTGYVFALYTNLVVERMPDALPGDRTAIDAARDMNGGLLTSLAKLVTFLGTTGFIAAGVAIAALVLVRRRHMLDAVTLALAFVAVRVGVQITKVAVDRPRPPDPLVDVSGSSFPSAHAANAVAYLALAVVVARHLRLATLRVAIVVAAAVLAAAVGLSRVYLRVHYLSDVTAGSALSLAIFSIAGCVALVISFLRKNEHAKAEDETAPAYSDEGERGVRQTG